MNDVFKYLYISIQLKKKNSYYEKKSIKKEKKQR